MTLDAVTEQWLITSVEELMKEREGLKARLDRVERRIAEQLGRASSVVVDDNTKGGPGTGKCYFDPLFPRDVNNTAIVEA